MLYMVIGASSSGKSEYAENTAMSLGIKRVYIATMKPYGDEAERKINRHKILRADKNFSTMEAPCNLGNIKLNGKGQTALLECIPNLVANEMFSEAGIINESPVKKIICDIKKLITQFENIVIVTGDVFSDGYVYDGYTEKYRKNLAEVNIELASLADCVTEVVCTIPNEIKNKKRRIGK